MFIVTRVFILFNIVIFCKSEFRYFLFLLNVSDANPVFRCQIFLVFHVVFHPPSWAIHGEEVECKVNVGLRAYPVSIKVAFNTLVPQSEEIILDVFADADKIMVNFEDMLHSFAFHCLLIH